MSSRTPAKSWDLVWIVGASTGIGRELALRLARAGARVVISSRSASALAELSAEHSGLAALPLDVSDQEAVGQAYRQLVSEYGMPDLVVLNAGIWQPLFVRDYRASAAVTSMSVNYFGIAFALEAVLPDMRARGRGHVALTASVAGYIGLPKAAAYAPSKAAVISLAEVLKSELEGTGVTVSLINPGFVKTPMADVNDFPMPFIISSERAAAIIEDGLRAGRFEIAFPWQLVAMFKILKLLPYPLMFWVVRRMTGAKKRARTGQDR